MHTIKNFAVLSLLFLISISNDIIRAAEESVFNLKKYTDNSSPVVVKVVSSINKSDPVVATATRINLEHQDTTENKFFYEICYTMGSEMRSQYIADASEHLKGNKYKIYLSIQNGGIPATTDGQQYLRMFCCRYDCGRAYRFMLIPQDLVITQSMYNSKEECAQQ